MTGGTRADSRSRAPWYHRPEWVGVISAMLIGAMGAVAAYADGQARISQNTHDIADLRQAVAAVPERLTRIETKVDDLAAFEKRRNSEKGDQ